VRLNLREESKEKSKKRLSPFGRVYEKNWPMAMLKTGVGVTPEVATGERDFLNLVMTYIRHRVTAITTQGTSPLSKSTAVTAPPHIAPAIREAANRKTLLLCGSKLTSCPAIAVSATMPNRKMEPSSEPAFENARERDFYQ
jgi:hypothetical protein